MTLVAKGLFEGGVQKREGCYCNGDADVKLDCCSPFGIVSLCVGQALLPSICMINTDMVWCVPCTMYRYITDGA
jgi:hypothetical protein